MAVSRADKRMPPGFRFHPTDEELVMYYLKRKIMGKRLCYDVISELDIYQHAPWDLPEFAILQTGDLNWYFFCPCKKKHASSGRTNRATESGYWKATGNDRVVHYKDRMVGKIKTLVFHWGKPPKGERMDWVMHEFRLDDSELTGVAQDAYVICRIFKKSGLGPKNGEQYGAPFREEDWEGDDDDDNNQIQGGAAFALFSGGHSVGNNLENSANLGHVNQIGSVTSLSEQVSDAIQGGASFVPLAGGHSVGNIQESSDMTANLGHDNHSGFVTSMSEQALDGNYLLPSADDGLTKPNASDNLILTINEPQGQSQSPVILFYDNNVDVEELLALFDDDAGNAGMPAQGITETDPQIADVNGDDIFGDLQSLDEFQYSSHFTPGYAAQSFRLDGDFLEEKDLDEDQL